jgi:hypothetical protein
MRNAGDQRLFRSGVVLDVLRHDSLLVRHVAAKRATKAVSAPARVDGIGSSD